MLRSEYGQVCKIKQHGLNCNDTALLHHFPAHEDKLCSVTVFSDVKVTLLS